MKYLYLITILIYLSISVISLGTFRKVAVAKALAPEGGAKTQVKATLPFKTVLRIFGYTAPNAIVQFDAFRVFAQTSSNKTGYFQLNEIPISFEAKEICITTIDSQRRTGFPLCINIPDREAEIGPLLLSPTLSLSSPLIWQNQAAYISGQTIPDSEVRIAFFEVLPATLAQNFYGKLAKTVKPQAYAFDLPPLSAISDKKGNYSMNVPSSKAIGYRIFSKAFYKGAPTPKSQTLAFAIGPITRYFYRYILPWLIFWLILITTGVTGAVYEKRTKKGRMWLFRFNEKRLKPFVIKKHLALRRILYNLQEYWRSRRK